jgi:phenylalanyl-tRNA synthetase alpha chain
MSAMQESQKKLNSIHDQAVSEIEQSQDSKALYEVKVRFLGKSGALTELMKEMASLGKDEKPAFGKLINEAKAGVEQKYAAREQVLKRAEIEQKLLSETLDLTLPSADLSVGSIHPVNQLIDEI